MTSRIGGHGSIMLISLHAFGKIVQYFGSDNASGGDYEGEYEVWKDETSASRSPRTQDPTRTGDSGRDSPIKTSRGGEKIRKNSVDDLQLFTKPVRKRKKSISYDDLKEMTLANSTKNHHEHAKQAMADRGSEDSSLVSVSLPSTVRSHWITALSRRTVGFSVHLARTLTVTDNLLAGIMRIGTAVGVIFTVLFGIISVLSVLQQNLNLFPKLLTYHSFNDSILINHIISNVTLQKNPQTYGDHQCHYSHPPPLHFNSSEIDNCPEEETFIRTLKKPLYASCSMRWNTLSILDFAILSELSYFDEPQLTANHSDHVTVQQMLDDLFPDLDFVQIKPTTRDEQNISSFEGAHPIYLEVASEKLGLTVVAVRGTDVGRLHDFLGKLLIITLSLPSHSHSQRM
jgi:hypothetical protein